MKARMLLLLALAAAPAFAFAQTHTQYPGAAPATASPSLRVCADPNNLPFSNEAEQGFENKLARMLAHSLGKQVQFVWHEQGKEFLRDTLNAGICDVVIGLPTDDHAYGVLTTDPYYRSAYVLVYRADAPYQLKSLDDPRLRTLEIGVHATGDDWVDLPGGATLAHRGIVKNVHVYTLGVDDSHANPSADLVDAVAKGDIDVAIAWGPLAGYFASREPAKLKLVPLTDTHTLLPFQFSISMAVRHGNGALRDKLNAFLATHRAAVGQLLARYGVPQLKMPAAGAPRLQAGFARSGASE
jgi:quinoprotein dehydrogenase-associated probable ABC transporter substrate-binding protein